MKAPSFTTVFRVFAVCYLALRVLDLTQTAYGLSRGLQEGNPIYPYTGLGGLITLNIVFVTAILSWAVLEEKRKVKWTQLLDVSVLVLLILQSAYVVLSNFRLL